MRQQDLHVAITGGLGYVGKRVAAALKRRNFRVTLLDVSKPTDGDKDMDGLEYETADICKFEQLEHTFELLGRVDAVVHTAGFGLCGTFNLPAFDEDTERVNVRGTENVIAICKARGVRALVFTSTVNVAFNGLELSEAEEAEFADHPSIDCYSRTKGVAEQHVLRANGDSTRTCVLRLGGIYGPKEGVILKRTIKFIEYGLVGLATCIKEDLRIDFLHIDNAVQAHVQAIDKLLLEPSDTIGGQIFNVTDGHPTSLRYIVDPLYSALTGKGEPRPLIRVPPAFMVSLAAIFATLSSLIGKSFALPFWGMTPMEAKKCSVSHTFSITKARQLLGYQPKVCSDKQSWDVIVASFDLASEKAQVRRGLVRGAIVASVVAYALHVIWMTVENGWK